MNYRNAIWRQQQANLLRYGIRAVDEVIDEPITLDEARQHLRVDTYTIDDPESDASPPDQITVSDDDAWIEAQIPAAREYCEQYIGRALAPRTMELATSAFPTVTVSDPPGPAFVLPFGPVASIVSVKYDDQAAADAAYTAAYDAEFLISGDATAAAAAGTAAAVAALVQTMPATDYQIDVYSTPSRLLLAYGASWPTSVRSAAGSVRVRYTTGYSTPGDSPQVFVLPKLARSAMLLMLAHFYENREAVGNGNLAEVPLGVQALLDLLPRERLGLA